MISITVGSVMVWRESIAAGLVQVVLIVAGTLLLAYSYCAKCPAKQKECGHPQIGWFRRFVPKRSAAPYTFFDLLGIGAFIIPTIMVPQIWLWGRWPLFIIFWTPLLIAGIFIIARFCLICPNHHCALNRCPKKSTLGGS
jgi:hypothetical protein